MTPVDYVSASLHIGLGLLLVWVFSFKFWRQHRVDALRERLFEVRGELFDYAALGEVSFDSPAYAKLRVMMNSMIRFAHKFTFSRLVIVVLFRKVFEALPIPSPLAEWEKAVAVLPPAKQKVLRDLHGRMMSTIAWHMISGSPIQYGIYLAYTLIHLASGKPKRLDEVSGDLPGVHIMEVQAINAELEEEECSLDAVPA